MPQLSLRAAQPDACSAATYLKAIQAPATAARSALATTSFPRSSRAIDGSLTALRERESADGKDKRKRVDPSVALAVFAPSDAVVGRFHTGRRIDNRPESLPNWRVSATTSETAAAISQLLGGATADDWTQGVVTGSPAVRVVLDGADSVTTELRLWGPKGLVHHCDGVLFLSPTEVQGTPCGCPESSEERAALAKKLRAPQPATTVVFRLAGRYDLGRFEFSSPSRLLADAAVKTRTQLAGIAGEALCELALELVTVTVGGGVEVSYRKPTLTVLGPWS
ncbi:hypothetical protein ACIRVF_30855 [Kitasatospora sp. NPDC101157]|uniref:recombination directionality factor n=1 Tax=Kitasatospora sp. NPDC101157 TaxID=3364098 RepID=UPI0038238D95